MAHEVRIIEGGTHRRVVLRVTGYNIRRVPSRFELVEDEQQTDLTTEQLPVFVVAAFPTEALEGTL